ncbi:response regulator [Streptomyces triticirhizae]|uniref:DNA-binding response regulator n=1 Tax=Streptomyces triticirhizae TaxID=2483353 RepID=A0A3M2LI47_9ACTN|nr:response regulator transcription factor [Streptomyces triticirhizae]RMI37152.1 DNA-binding response regulator [Streptomyces triticirhizae]
MAHPRSPEDVPAPVGEAAGAPDASPEGPAARRVRVVLADDQTVVRAGFRALLDLSDDLAVVAEAADGEQAVRAARLTRPDVVLMDIRMPGVDGLEATRRIAADPGLAATRVLVLTTYEADEYVFESLRAGAGGFLLKDVEPDELREAIRTVAAGRSLLAPAVTRRVIEEFARLRAPLADGDRRLAGLTGREREVMALVAAGLSNEEIGARLTMSPLTAKTHVSRAMTKLGARDRAQLVVIAYETGLVRAGSGE